MELSEIKQAIEKSIENSEAFILDPRNDGVHLEAIVVSSSFESISLLKQHKLVMSSLKENFKDASLHALAVKTFMPQKWSEQRSNYQL